jgi:hypothetical protein
MTLSNNINKYVIVQTVTRQQFCESGSQQQQQEGM